MDNGTMVFPSIVRGSGSILHVSNVSSRCAN